MGKTILTYRGYRGTLQYSQEDNLFVGEVLGIRDFLGYHGRTETEALEHFHSCIDQYIVMRKELGNYGPQL